MLKLTHDKFNNTITDLEKNIKHIKDLDAEEDIENIYFNSLYIAIKDKKSLDKSKKEEIINASLRLIWESFILALDM